MRSAAKWFVVYSEQGWAMPFQKGQSGNPGGRPKALAAWRKSDEAQRLRDLAYDVLEDACINADKVSDRIMAARELLDRTEGKPVQAIVGEDGQPVRIGVDVLGALQRLAGG